MGFVSQYPVIEINANDGTAIYTPCHSGFLPDNSSYGTHGTLGDICTWNTMKLLVFCLSLLGLTLASKSYDGYKVFRVQVKSDQDAEILQVLDASPSVDFWTDIRRQGPVDIMVEPARQQAFEELMATNSLEYSTMIHNLTPLFDAEKKSMQTKVKGSQAKYNMDWESYHPLEDFYEYFDYLEAQYEDISTEVIGKSFEGRDLRVLKICRGGTCGQKPAMFLDGGIHAREWISPATVTYMINELTENLDASNEDLLDNLDWYFLPSVNPDGYYFTQTSDRLWRKTRSDFGALCKGTDANRNFGFQFATGGASNSPCSDTYHGPEAFSELETQAVKGFIDSNKDHIRFYNNIHSYSQLILTPWGYSDELVPDYDDIKRVADTANAALYAVHQKSYEVGCIPCVLYVASGNSIDYTYGDAGIKYSYSIELRDTGVYGFLLPAEQIIPTGEEIFAFHASAARQIVQEYA
eukprot:maker-scaffold695_size110128-snap-gene-0.17 protein:Tk05645 transcript:maker-scaffold695_size110128-snap-gene-0.17-mRNA-1 annotation:"carboxypeptidase b"